MKVRRTLLIAIVLAAANLPAAQAQHSNRADQGEPGQSTDSANSPWLQYATPGEAGFSADGLAAARRVAEASDSAAVLAIYRGRVLVAWGDVERRFKCHSIRKSLLSALIGIHVDEDRLDLHKTLADLGIDDKQGLTDVEKSARVIDLLRARSGVYHPAAKEPADMSANRPARGSRAPDEHWWYNNWDFNTLLTIYEQETQARVFEDFAKRIASPIGMEDFRVQDGYYQLEPRKSLHPAYAFRLSARDLARFGELFRLEGEWNGKQVVPADWVIESTRSHSSTDRGSGYGYMWWTHSAGSLGSSYPTLNDLESFAARGTGGQFVLVVPAAEFVFVHRGDTDNDRRVSGSAIWRMAELLLSSLEDEAEPQPELVALHSTPFANPGPHPKTYSEIPLDPASIESFVGEYQIAPGVLGEVYEYDGRLFIHSPMGGAELFAAGSHQFFCRAADVQIEFLPDADGEIHVLRFSIDGRQSEARRVGSRR